MVSEIPDRGKVEADINEAAWQGLLAEYLARHPDTANPVLYGIVAGVVFEGLTRRLERRRGHHRCAVSAESLLPECHDRFQDDVEAALLDLLKHAGDRIENIGGWVASRLNAVTVDAHRRRRGDRGAQQRPRLPQWLRKALGPDPWLLALALDILTWVGVPATAPGGLWPLGAWAEKRRADTGASDVTEGQVAADVERVLAAMRKKPDWYEKYVERPLGRKQAPLTGALRAAGDADREPEHVCCAGPDAAAEAELHAFAAQVIAAVEGRMRAGEQPHAAILDVLTQVFDGGTGSEDLDRTPGSAPDVDESVARLIADPETLNRVVEVLTAIVLETPEQDAGRG